MRIWGLALTLLISCGGDPVAPEVRCGGGKCRMDIVDGTKALICSEDECLCLDDMIIERCEPVDELTEAAVTDLYLSGCCEE